MRLEDRPCVTVNGPGPAGPAAANELADAPRAAARRGRTRQVLLVFAAWLLAWVPHARNDGLWYQGDSPRHAATGLFYKYALTNLSSHPLAYAKAFAQRYPIIAPQTYPPVFHLAEAVAFALCGPSPYVGKALVLLCALMAALYLLAWLRRWVAVEVGELAVLLLLVPGVLLWSNVIMLNVPSFALLLASLYHTRRWLEGADRQVYPAAAWGLLALLAYPQSGVLVFVGGAWLVALRRWDLLLSLRTMVLALACALAILPWVVIIATYSPHLAVWAVPPPTTFTLHRGYLYYLRHAPETYGVFLLALAAVGSVAGLWGRDTRREARILLIWLGVTYAVFSLVRGKDPRYAISLAAPLVLLAALAVLGVGRAIARVSGRDIAGPVVSVLSLAVLATQAALSWNVPVPEAKGFREVVRYLRQVEPRGPVIYDGYQYGVFGYYALIDDPTLQRGLIDYGHLFYKAGLSDPSREGAPSDRAAQVVSLLEEADCRWVAIEISPKSPQFEVGHALRDALRGGRFELVRSFPVSGEGASRVDVYRLIPRPGRTRVAARSGIHGGPRHVRPAPAAQLR